MADKNSSHLPRKRPSQARSKQTVAWIVDGAARVFRREGFAATTNRIAHEAGVSVGTLYEYFPNKQSLLVALAERHLDEAEQGIGAALQHANTTSEFLEQLQRAIVASHRYPSGAIDLVTDVPGVGERLQKRAAALRTRVLDALCDRARATGLSEPRVRARIAFGLIAELSSRTSYEVDSPDEHAPFAHRLLALANQALEGGPP